ncbi:MAG: hypothetical protein KDB14_34835 [Planctomycetales bacterium]|nr:hypothetical protein [Planctomycetales bacterium]
MAIAMLLVWTAPLTATEPGVTSLANPGVNYRQAAGHYAVLSAGDVRAVIVDNDAVDDATLPKHRAGYNGIASLTHAKQPRNVFVPSFAGVNFEHIHDGATDRLREKFEPRKAPLELRIIDERTVELYQPPTPHFHLESCGRYQMLPSGVIEYTFECVPREPNFSKGYIGLFWASYIHEPAEKVIHFRGRSRGDDAPGAWLVGRTPQHGVLSSHRPAGWQDALAPIDDDFPLTLVNHPSNVEHTDNWYFGVCRDMALVQIFRKRDRVHLAQSPTGGGAGNPAWDFQWFQPNCEVGKLYRLVMRVAYLPYRSVEQLEADVAPYRFAE